MGRKSTSLTGQFTYAINQCFSEGMDKHSFKKEYGQEMTDKVFSYNEKFRLKDTAKMLWNYFRENDIKVKQVNQITADHIQGFLSSKVGNCTQNTINTYAASLYKLQEVCNSTYKSCNLEWRKSVTVPTALRQSDLSRGVTAQISREDYNKILEYAKENYSQSGQAIRLQDTLGLRVNEIVTIKIRNIDLDRNKIVIENTKGGKTLERDLTPEAKKIILETLSKSSVGDKLFNLDPGSINKYLSRVQDKMGLARHSNHDIRRRIAQEKYDQYREKGDSPKEAARKTSIWLNHGANREKLLKESYIVIW